MENNFFQMAPSAGHAMAYTIGTIFKHIIDCKHAEFPQWLHELSSKASIISGLSA